MDILYLDINDDEISLLLSSTLTIIKKEIYSFDRWQIYNLNILNIAYLANIINNFCNLSNFKKPHLIITIHSKNLYEFFDNNNEYDFDDKQFFCIDYKITNELFTNKTYHALINNSVIFQYAALAAILNLTITIITTKYILCHLTGNKTVKDIDLIKTFYRMINNEKNKFI